jgi:hypothetical protein
MEIKIAITKKIIKGIGILKNHHFRELDSGIPKNRTFCDPDSEAREQSHSTQCSQDGEIPIRVIRKPLKAPQIKPHQCSHNG